MPNYLVIMLLTYVLSIYDNKQQQEIRIILKSCLLCLIFLLRKLVPVINGFEQVQKLQIIQILLGHKFFLVFGHHWFDSGKFR